MLKTRAPPSSSSPAPAPAAEPDAGEVFGHEDDDEEDPPVVKYAISQLAHEIEQPHPQDEHDQEPSPPQGEHQMVTMVDALQTLGVSALDACPTRELV